MEHRIACGWFKYRGLQQTLQNRHISVRLRLKLFDAVVTPTVLYALETCPMPAACLQKLDLAQRCMLRRMVGWVCYDTDTWEVRGHRMKTRLQQALAQHPQAEWSKQIAFRNKKLHDEIRDLPFWTREACAWDPRATAVLNSHVTHRGVGRPRVRW